MRKEMENNSVFQIEIRNREKNTIGINGPGPSVFSKSPSYEKSDCIHER